MSLDKGGLKTKLLDMMTKAANENWTPDQVADGLATAIDGYVRGGTVSGVVVALPDGTPANQSNQVALT